MVFAADQTQRLLLLLEPEKDYEGSAGLKKKNIYGYESTKMFMFARMGFMSKLFIFSMGYLIFSSIGSEGISEGLA